MFYYAVKYIFAYIFNIYFNAQAAVQLLENWEKYGLKEQPIIDNLVLVGSPVQKGSSLYNTLKQYEKDGLIKNFEYKDFQASAEGKFDFVTGLAGFSPIDGAVRGLVSFLGMIGGGAIGVDYHIQMATDEKFGDKMKQKLESNLKGDDKNKGEARPIR